MLYSSFIFTLNEKILARSEQYLTVWEKTSAPSSQTTFVEISFLIQCLTIWQFQRQQNYSALTNYFYSYFLKGFFSRMACNNVEKMINFILIENGNLGWTFCTFDWIVKFVVSRLEIFAFKFLRFLFWFLIVGSGKLQLLGEVDITVHHEHRSILMTVDVVSLTVKTQNGETGGAVQDGVAGAHCFRVIWLVLARLRSENFNFVHECNCFIIIFFAISFHKK